MKYITRGEAIEREIITAIEQGFASSDEYDIDAIADELLIFDGQYYTVAEALSHLATVDETLATVAPHVEEIMTFFILFGYDSPREYPRMRRTGWCEVTAPDIEATHKITHQHTA